VDFVNLNLDFPLQWIYQDYGGSLAGQGTLLLFGQDVFPGNTTDMLLGIKGFGGASPALLELVYAQDSTTLYAAQLGTVHVKQVSATPIPPALPLLASALGGLGFAGWRRHKAA
jgi:hypothetical protein